MTRKILLCLFMATSAWAQGRVQTSANQLGSTNNYVLTYNWVGDASSGSIPITQDRLTCCQGFFISQVEVVPASPSPTAGYSITITDGAGVDVLAGGGSSLSGTATSTIRSGYAAPIQGSLTLNMSGQSVASARGAIYVFIVKSDAFLFSSGNNTIPSPYQIALPGTNTIGPAIDGTPTGGTLYVPVGNYTFTSAVTVSRPISIICQPGALFLNATADLIMTTFTGAHQSVNGCTYDGQSQSTRPIVGSAGSTYFTVSESTFQNLGNNARGYAGILFNGSWGTFSNNRFLNIGAAIQCSGDCPGVSGTDAHYVTVSGNQFSDIWGNAVHFFSTNIAVNPGDFIRVADNTVHNIGRNCIEFGPFVYQKIDVTGNYCDTWTGVGFGISVGFVPGSGVVSVVSGNTLYQPDSALSLLAGGTYGLEMLCDYCVSEANYVYGSFTNGVIVGGHDQKVVHNYLWKNQIGIAENDSSYFPINTTIEDNTIIEARDAGIVSGGNGGGGSKIIHNTVIRTPGSWSGDSGRTFSSVVAGNYLPGTNGAAPIRIQGNEFTNEISATTLTAWYGIALEASATSLNAGSMIRDNTWWNKNAIAAGIAYRDLGNSALGGVSETGNRYFNLSSIGNPADGGLSNVSISYYADNVSLIGNGSGTPPVDYTIGTNTVVRAYQLTGQSGTIGSTNAIFIGLKGIYLVSANTHIVSTNNTGTLSGTLTIPRTGTASFGPTISTGVDGSSSAQLCFLNVNDQISYATTAAGLTATNYTVSVTAVLVSALQ